MARHEKTLSARQPSVNQNDKHQLFLNQNDNHQNPLESEKYILNGMGKWFIDGIRAHPSNDGFLGFHWMESHDAARTRMKKHQNLRYFLFAPRNLQMRGTRERTAN